TSSDRDCSSDVCSSDLSGRRHLAVHAAGDGGCRRGVVAHAAPQGAVSMNARTRASVLTYAGLTFFLLLALFPIYWMVITAFKQPDRKSTRLNSSHDQIS